MDLFNDPCSARGSIFAPQPNPRSSSKPTKNPKVVPIPVHHVGSEPEVAKKRAPPATRAGAAVKGLNNMAIVRKMEAEVDEIERSILAAQEAIRRDGKEGIRFNEMLMQCLFRLDSVHGVKVYRKKVIRRVILLQEAVDAISAAGKPLKDPAAPPSDAIEAAETSEDVPEEVITAEESLEASKSNLARDSDKEASQSCSFLEVKDMMEKMMVESASRAKQCRIMEGLVKRVEKLEKAVQRMEERSAQQCRIMEGLVKRVEKAVQRMEEKPEMVSLYQY